MPEYQVARFHVQRVGNRENVLWLGVLGGPVSIWESAETVMRAALASGFWSRAFASRAARMRWPMVKLSADTGIA